MYTICFYSYSMRINYIVFFQNNLVYINKKVYTCREILLRSGFFNYPFWHFPPNLRSNHHQFYFNYSYDLLHFVRSPLAL